MNEEEVLQILQDVGAFRTGHFVFTSGLHADTYINKDAIYPHTAETSRLCKAFAEKTQHLEIDAVMGPAIGASILAQWTAYHLSQMLGRDIYAVYADKDGNGGFVIRRGYDKVIEGKNVLIVEDLTTTGGSVEKVVEAGRAIGATIVGALALVNRGNVTKEQAGDPPFFDSLLNVHLEQWPENDCELCKANIPVNTDVGHGREFLNRTKAD